LFPTESSPSSACSSSFVSEEMTNYVFKGSTFSLITGPKGPTTALLAFLGGSSIGGSSFVVGSST